MSDEWGTTLWQPLHAWLGNAGWPPCNSQKNAPRPLIIVAAGPGLSLIPIHALRSSLDGYGDCRYAADDYIISPKPSVVWGPHRLIGV